MIASTTNGKVFVDEDVEAELLLDELYWSSSASEGNGAGAPEELHNKMTKQSENLNMEIIDFLLQWEEDENVSADKKPKNGAADNDPGVRRVTMEVLGALSHVDEQLSSVDEWLGEQIERLSEIQSKLHMIEAESGALETSWHNLSNVKTTISVVIEGLSLPEEYETLLMSPHILVEAILKDSELRDRDGMLKVLILAIELLRKCMAFKGNADASKPAALPGPGNFTITPQQWKELLYVTGISSQLNKLLEIADSFCNSLNDTMPNLFDGILKHKCLHDGNSSRNISVKHFNFGIVATECLIYCSATPRYRFGSKWFRRHICSNGSGSMKTVKVADSTKMLNQHLNPIYCVQESFHIMTSLFTQLNVHFLELAPAILPAMKKSYETAVDERFYSLLVKGLFHEVTASITNNAASSSAATAALSLATVHKCAALHDTGKVVSNAISFRGTKRITGSTVSVPVSPWIAFELVLQLIAPVIRREEAFCKVCV